MEEKLFRKYVSLLIGNIILTIMLAYTCIKLYEYYSELWYLFLIVSFCIAFGQNIDLIALIRDAKSNNMNYKKLMIIYLCLLLFSVAFTIICVYMYFIHSYLIILVGFTLGLHLIRKSIELIVDAYKDNKKKA